MFHSISAYVILVIFLATLIRSTLGFGEALIAVPLLAMRMSLMMATPLAVLVSTVIAGVIVGQDWRHVKWRSAMVLLLTALPGIPLGIFLLAKGNEHVVKWILGVIIIGFSAYALKKRSAPGPRVDHWGWGVSCGFLSGVLGGAYGMNGPPLAIYGARRNWSPQHFRATLQGYFLPASLVGLLGYRALGIWSTEVMRYFFLSLPAMAFAIFLGRFINQRMKSHSFLRFVYLGLIVVGSVLVSQAMVR